MDERSREQGEGEEEEGVGEGGEEWKTKRREKGEA